MSLKHLSKEDVKKHYKSRIDISAFNRIEKLANKIMLASPFFDVFSTKHKNRKLITFGIVFNCPCGGKSFFGTFYRYEDAILLNIESEKNKFLNMARAHLAEENYKAEF